MTRLCNVIGVCRRLLYSAALVLAKPVVASEAEGYFFELDSFNYSGATPINSYLNFLVGAPPEGGENALSRNRVAYGVAKNDWRFSLVHRNDYNLDFTEDAADFSWRNKNRVTIPNDELFDVEVWANQYQLTGFHAERSWQKWSGWQFNVAAGLYAATESRYGYLGKNPEGEGGLISLSERTLDGVTRRQLIGDLYTDYYFSKDPFFEQDAEAKTGVAYSLDFGFRWQAMTNIEIEGQFEDILADIYWRDMPHTTAKATSDTVVFDEDGFLQAVPNFEGTLNYDDIRQPLVGRDTLNAWYLLNSFRVGYEFDQIGRVQLNRAVALYRWADSWSVRCAYEWDSGAQSYQLDMPVGRLALTFDTLDMDQARTLGLSWSFIYRL